MFSLGCVTGLGSDLCLSRSGIETSIIVPGAFTGGTNHFAHPGSPKDKSRAPEYDAVPYAGLGEQVRKGFSAIVPLGRLAEHSCKTKRPKPNRRAGCQCLELDFQFTPESSAIRHSPLAAVVT